VQFDEAATQGKIAPHLCGRAGKMPALPGCEIFVRVHSALKADNRWLIAFPIKTFSTIPRASFKLRTIGKKADKREG